MEDHQLAEVLKSIYYNADNTASFSSAEKLFRAAVKVNSAITRYAVKKWLASQKVYTLHRPKRRYFERNHVIATAVDDVWQADLVDMQAFKRINKGYGYILTIVDVLSKFAHAVPVKTKHGSVIAAAFESVFATKFPAHLQTDQGKEFLNSDVQKVFKEFSVHFYTTKDADIKCSIVERFNRTLRSRMFRYFTLKGSYSYLEVLQKLVDSYNRTEHSATGMCPIDVDTVDEKTVFRTLYGYRSRREMMMASRGESAKIIPVGAIVRIKFREKIMEKGYYPSWSDELFTVVKAIKGGRIMYILKDHTGETIEGRFYAEEVQEVKDDSYRISVIRTRVRKGVKELLVHWIGYPSSQDSWLKEADIIDING